MQNVFPQKSQHDAIQYWQYHSIKIIQMTGRYAQLAVNWFWEWTGNQYHSGILPIKPSLCVTVYVLPPKLLAMFQRKAIFQRKNKCGGNPGVETWTSKISARKSLQLWFCHIIGSIFTSCTVSALGGLPCGMDHQSRKLNFHDQGQEGLGPNEFCFWDNFQVSQECKETGLRSYSNILIWVMAVQYMINHDRLISPLALVHIWCHICYICASLFTQGSLLTPRLTPDTGVLLSCFVAIWHVWSLLLQGLWCETVYILKSRII